MYLACWYFTKTSLILQKNPLSVDHIFLLDLIANHQLLFLLWSPTWRAQLSKGLPSLSLDPRLREMIFQTFSSTSQTDLLTANSVSVFLREASERTMTWVSDDDIGIHKWEKNDLEQNNHLPNIPRNRCPEKIFQTRNYNLKLEPK